MSSALAPTATTTSGTGSALQAIPKRRRRLVRVEVDSYDRNLVNYPSTNLFRWEFKYPLKGVTEVKLVNGQIPIPLYNIDEAWNKFTFQEGLNRFTIVLPIGFYGSDIAIASQLQQSLNTTPGITNTYAVTIDPLTHILVITRTAGVASFGVLFATGRYLDEIDTKTGGITTLNSPQAILGFSYSDTYDRSGVLKGSYAVNVKATVRRIYVYLNFDSNIDLRSVDRSQGRKEPSAILYLDSENNYGQYRVLNQDSYDMVMDCGSAGISRVSALNVELRDEFGRLLNIQNRPVSLLLEMNVTE